jgi:hypothetical protein
MSDREDERAFKVQDRRRFDAEGNRRPGQDDAPATPRFVPPPAHPSPAQPPASSGRPAAQPARPAEPPPAARPGAAPARPAPEEEGRISFSEFVLSLGTNAAQMLGGEDPDSVPSRPDLVNAVQHIDILAMLHRKTAGNLTAEEQQLLESILHELQMRYLEVARALQGRR